MILLAFFIAGLLIGTVRRGGLSGLVKLRGVWLILISVAIERSFMFLPVLAPQFFPEWTVIIQSARFLPLFVFILLNVKNWRVDVAGLGIAMNFAVIAANAWRMPVSWQASLAQELADYVNRVQSGVMPEYMIMGSYAGANLWYLSDIIPIKIIQAIPTNYISIGDILLGVGLMLAVQNCMAKYSVGRHVRGSRARHNDEKLGRLRRKEHAVIIEEPAETALEVPVDRNAFPEQQIVVTELEPRHDTKKEIWQPIPSPDTQLPVAPPPWEQEPLDEDTHQESIQTMYESTDTDYDSSPVKLPPRLAAVASMVTRGAVVADVGCDHGKLAVWLAMNGAPFVVATDISAKSLSKTKKLVNGLDLQHVVQTRVCDGLKKLKPSEAEVIVIAGLGGPTICSILESGYSVAGSAFRLVLQPMNAVGEVRRWLVDNGFYIVDEQLAEEEGRVYQIIAAEPGSDGSLPMSLFELEVGHLLIENRHPLLPKLLEFKITTIDNILAELAGNNSARAEARRSELISLKERCAEVAESL